MKTATQNAITVECTILASVEQVWKYWTQPKHIQNWCAASDDWHAPYAENDVRLNGKFKTKMAAKDGSFSFDFEGIYTNVEDLKKIDYQMGDGRNVEVEFVDKGESTQVIETFEAESLHPMEMQQQGWQSILNNFKKYVESQK